MSPPYGPAPFFGIVDDVKRDRRQKVARDRTAREAPPPSV
jgi:hypothetical protein